MRKLALTVAVGAGTLFARSDEEAALGKYMAAQFSKSVTPLDNPEVQNYIDRLGDAPERKCLACYGHE